MAGVVFHGALLLACHGVEMGFGFLLVWRMEFQHGCSLGNDVFAQREF